MKKYYMILMALVSLCFTTSCKDDDKDSSIATSFSALTANGSATETTTVLTLTFDKAIEGLTADDITLTTGETGTTKGALTAKDAAGVYELAVSGITKAGEVTVGVAKEGYTISPASKTVAVTFSAIAIPATFSTLAANGSATETTTILTLTFDKAIDGLTADDIALTAGETGTTKGALTAKEAAGVYELVVSGITKAGDVIVGVAKAGYTITPASKTVAVTFVTTGIPATFNTLAANGSTTETTTVLTLTFDKAIDGLTADDITLTSGETGATKGTLTAKGAGVYELAVSGITKAGEVTVAVAKEGYTITPASKTVAVTFVASVAFSNATANGSVTVTTTILTLTFDKAIEGLTATDITLTAGETGATKGTLTAKGAGVYELAVSGITKAGDVTVGIAKTGYTITPASKTVAVTFVASALITNKALITAIEAAASVTFDKNAGGDVDVKATGNKSKIESITNLNIMSKSLTSLAGIEHFTNLTTLNCSNNDLSTLDVTSLVNLTTLFCNSTKLTTLDVTPLVKLIYLYCTSNLLTTLNVSPLVNLKSLHCSNNLLTALNVSPLVELTTLNCYMNEITSLDVSMLPVLKLNPDNFKCGKQDIGGITVTVSQAQDTNKTANWLSDGNNTGITLNVK